MKKTTMLLVLTLLFSVFISASSFAATPHTKLKVGFPIISGFSEVSEDGTYTGLVYDYLIQISQYTGWEYEFIVGDLSTLLQKLKNNEIDLMGGMFKREGYDKYVAYPKYNSGHIYSTLITASDNQSINGSNISSLNNTTIGVYANAINKIESMESFLSANDITYNIKRYDDTDEYLSSLKNKEVDILLSSDTQEIENTRVVSRFVSESHYIVTYKGNTEVLDQLNKALEQIQEVDPAFSFNLYLNYFGKFNNNPVYLSEAEKSYINQLPPLVVAAASNWAPFQYLDKEGQLRGISIDILHMIAERTGLKFEFVQTDNHRAAVKLVENGQADLTAGVPISKEVFLGADITVTQPYLSFYKVLIKNKQSDRISVDSLAASSINYHFLMDTKVKNIRYFDTLQESIEATNSGKADYTYGDHYSIEYIMANNNYQNIVISTLVDSNELMHIGLSQTLDTKLLTIMNKAIRSITEYEKSTITLNTYLEHEKKVTLKSLIDSNPLTAQYILLGVIFIVCLAFALFLRIRISANRKMYYLANTDPLTGSRNFARFKKDAAELLKSDTPYILSYTDFQAFKYINDRYGYAEGDRILRQVTQVLESVLRPNEACCRITGDTFVILTENRSREELLERYFNYCDQISQIKVGNDSNYMLKLWSGFFCQDDPKQKFTIFEMMDRAILAQKQVKEKREINYVFYEDSMRDQMLKEQSIESKMSAALQNGEFVVYLQPKYDMQHMKPTSAEALVRWITAEGVIPPCDFIPLFERNYFIVELDKYIFEQCCKVLRYWIDHNMPVISIAVNVSRVQLSSDEFVRTYIQIKEKYRIPNGYLELEFTESIVFDDTARLMGIVNKLKNAGFTCAIDDFGRGYSSLTVLKDIPADSLKMDAQFFAKGHDKNKDTIMIESTMAMGKALHMKVVAEGIETWDQVEYLKGIGCNMIQGYVFAKPMPVDQFEQFLADALSSS